MHNSCYCRLYTQDKRSPSTRGREKMCLFRLADFILPTIHLISLDFILFSFSFRKDYRNFKSQKIYELVNFSEMPELPTSWFTSISNEMELIHCFCIVVTDSVCWNQKKKKEDMSLLPVWFSCHTHQRLCCERGSRLFVGVGNIWKGDLNFCSLEPVVIDRQSTVSMGKIFRLPPASSTFAGVIRSNVQSGSSCLAFYSAFVQPV